MGRLLGDPEVWDDSPARPRPAVRGLAGLAVGAVAGLLLAFAVVPRPDPPPLEVRLPPSAEAPRLRVEKQVLYSASLGGGPMLLSRSGRLEEVNPDGTDRRVVAQNLRARAVVGPDRTGTLVALDSGLVIRVEADGGGHRLGPDDFVADGLAGAGRQLLACPAPAGQPVDGSLLLDADSGRARPVKLGCPVAWAARGGVFAGAGALAPGRGLQRAAAVPKGGSVLLGRPGARPRVLLDARRLRRLAGAGAVVDGLALSPDGRLVAVSAGRPGAVAGAGGRERRAPGDQHPAGRRAPAGLARLVGPTGLDHAGRRRRRPPRRPGHRRAGGQAGERLRARLAAGRRRRPVLASGVPMVAADGFAWSSDGDSVAVSSPAGVLVVKQSDVVYTTASPVTGTLLAWPAGATP